MAKESKIPEKIICRILLDMAKNKEIFIGTKRNGEKIYSLIEEYEKNTIFLEKLKDAIIGRIIR